MSQVVQKAGAGQGLEAGALPDILQAKREVLAEIEGLLSPGRFNDFKGRALPKLEKAGGLRSSADWDGLLTAAREVPEELLVEFTEGVLVSYAENRNSLLRSRRLQTGRDYLGVAHDFRVVLELFPTEYAVDLTKNAIPALIWAGGLETQVAWDSLEGILEKRLIPEKELVRYVRHGLAALAGAGGLETPQDWKNYEDALQLIPISDRAYFTEAAVTGLIRAGGLGSQANWGHYLGGLKHVPEGQRVYFTVSALPTLIGAAKEKGADWGNSSEKYWETMKIMPEGDAVELTMYSLPKIFEAGGFRSPGDWDRYLDVVAMVKPDGRNIFSLSILPEMMEGGRLKTPEDWVCFQKSLRLVSQDLMVAYSKMLFYSAPEGYGAGSAGWELAARDFNEKIEPVQRDLRTAYAENVFVNLIEAGAPNDRDFWLATAREFDHAIAAFPEEDRRNITQSALPPLIAAGWFKKTGDWRRFAGAAALNDGSIEPYSATDIVCEAVPRLAETGVFTKSGVFEKYLASLRQVGGNDLNTYNREILPALISSGVLDTEEKWAGFINSMEPLAREERVKFLKDTLIPSILPSLTKEKSFDWGHIGEYVTNI